MKNLAVPALMMLVFASCSENQKTEAGPIEVAPVVSVEQTEQEAPKETEIVEEVEVEAEKLVEPTSNAPKPAAKSKATPKPATVTPRQSDAGIGDGGAVTNNTTEPVAPAAEPEKKKGLNHTAKGAIVGAVAGGVTGAIINKKDPLKGAAIGTAVGAGVGAGSGLIVDKSVEKKKEKEAEKN